MLFLFGIFFAAMYFFSIRPQQRRAKEQKEFADNLSKGDKVILNSGIHGKIFKAEENSVLVEVDTNVKLRVDKSAISAELSLPLNKSSKE